MVCTECDEEEAGEAGLCRSSANTEAMLGDIALAILLGDVGVAGAGEARDEPHDGTQLASVDPMDDADGRDEAGRTRMVNGEAEVVGKATTFRGVY